MILAAGVGVRLAVQSNVAFRVVLVTKKPILEGDASRTSILMRSPL